MTSRHGISQWFSNLGVWWNYWWGEWQYTLGPILKFVNQNHCGWAKSFIFFNRSSDDFDILWHLRFTIRKRWSAQPRSWTWWDSGSLASVIDCIIVQQIPLSPQLPLHRRCLLLCSKIVGSVYDIDFGQWKCKQIWHNFCSSNILALFMPLGFLSCVSALCHEKNLS